MHHLFFGIVLMMVAGGLSFAAGETDGPWYAIYAVLFGIGLGLTIDEYALWLHLDDVYWAREGRSSIDAALVALGLFGFVLLAFVPTRVGDDSFEVLATTVALATLHFGWVLVAAAKYRLVHALFGVFLPGLALYAGLRLAKPRSLWAKRFYGRRPSRRGPSSGSGPAARPTASRNACATRSVGSPRRSTRRGSRPQRPRLRSEALSAAGRLARGADRRRPAALARRQARLRRAAVVGNSEKRHLRLEPRQVIQRRDAEERPWGAIHRETLSRIRAPTRPGRSPRWGILRTQDSQSTRRARQMLFAADYPFMDVLWSMIIFFFWVIWIWIVVTVLIDIFRRTDIGGWGKAAWVVFVVILPWLGVLIYLIAQHDGMRDRRIQEAQAQKQAFDAYVQDAAGGSADQIARAKELLDSGTITQEEFQALKTKALA